MGLINNHKQTEFQTIHLALSVGLCGSITSFSASILDIYISFSGFNTTRNAFFNILAGIESFIAIMGLSIAFYSLGNFCSPQKSKSDKLFEWMNQISTRYLLLALVLINAILIVVAIISKNSIGYTLAGIISPVGTLYS